MPDGNSPGPAPQPPRAVRRAELIWEGKYDKDGRRTAPLRVALPFQTVETINESAADREALALFAGRITEKTPWRNRLIWGDKKYVLPSLLPEFAGKVNLIYIDPPFDTGADFSFTATVPDHPDTPEDDSFSFTKEPSIIEHKAYRDTWGRGLDSYLQWFYETVVLLHELLHETGSLYVHLDWHVGHYAKVIVDEVFGSQSFRNEIIWKRSNPKSHISVNFPTCTDAILYYTKTDVFTYAQPYEHHDPDYIESAYKYQDEKGCYRLLPLLNPNDDRPNLKYEFLGVTRVWRWTKERMQKAYEEGLVVQLKPGAVPQYKKYLHESLGRTVTNCWTDIQQASGNEAVGYPTQKPEALLERIIKASSNPGDLVLDIFAGSGTTAAVAEKLGRRWIAADLSRFAIHTTRKRLLSIPGVRPFVVQNLGKYERQVWAGTQFATVAQVSQPAVSPTSSRQNAASAQGVESANPPAAWQSASPPTGSPRFDEAAARQRAYIEFILKLYQATPVSGYTWLHGVRAGRMVHVGAVDAPVSVGDVTRIAAEFRKAIGSGKDAPTTNGVDVLGWDFAFELNEVARQQAAAANIQMRFLRIPRDVMDKRAVEQGDVHFFELAALAVEVKTRRREVTLTLTNFVIPPDDVPEEARRAVRHWSQWIDYWAVDWDNQGDTFHNQWQTYRTRKNPRLELTATHPYAGPGDYTVVVKVIDILGNDTTKTVKVKVK